MNTIEQQVGYSDFYDSLLDREEAGELTSEQVDTLDREFVARYPELEALRNELYNDVYMKLKELGKGKRDPNELYRNTAGEIEARESESRRNMTAEERRQKTPDLGWDRRCSRRMQVPPRKSNILFTPRRLSMKISENCVICSR